MRKFLIFVFVVFLAGFVSAASNSFVISYDYHWGMNETTPLKTVASSDVLLSVNTPEEMICKYSSSEGTPYSAMEGNFDETNSFVNKKTFLDLPDGTHRYYIKCLNSSNLSQEPGQLEVVFRTNSLVTGQIQLSENSPLKAGKIEIDLILSKYVSQTPELKYSLDGTKYEPVVLSGSGKNWKGYLVLEKNLGEGVLSFDFRAVDLTGQVGTEITAGKSFLYDTVKPPLITDIKAISQVGQVKLEWYAPEDAYVFRIYRSTTPNPDHTDFYKETSDDYYYDTGVEKGKTYYYRVTSVDRAGNEADFSKEVSGVSLGEEINESSSGLSPVLIGKVESFLLKVGDVEDQIKQVKQDLSEMGDEEKAFYKDLGFSKKLDKSEKELTSIKTLVEGYKSQDLTSEELDKKLASAQARLGILEKGVPTGVEIVEEDSRKEIEDDDFIVKALGELDNTLSEKEINKNLKETKRLAKENGLDIGSEFYVLSVGYLDGSSEKYAIVKRKLNSQFEKIDGAQFVEIFPDKIVKDYKVDLETLDGEFVSDNVLVFGSDVKEIYYSIKDFSDLDELKNIGIGFVYLEPSQRSSASLTGFSVFDAGDQKYPLIGGVVLILIILGYFIYTKRNNFSDDYYRIINRISEGEALLSQNKLKESKEVYGILKHLYSKLGKREKAKVLEKLDKFYGDISILELEIGLSELKKTKDKELFKRLEIIYEKLPSVHKDKIFTLFNKLKGEIENEK